MLIPVAEKTDQEPMDLHSVLVKRVEDGSASDDDDINENENEAEFLLRRKRQKSKRVYVILEVTPAIIILVTISLLLFLTYPLWPIWMKEKSENPKLIEKVENNTEPLKFHRPNGTENLRCDWVFNGNKEYTKQLAAHRLVFSDPPELDISCSAIKKRNFFQTRAASAEELEFPVARARIVYKDYIFLEMELSANYAPQNQYCYAIDEKADPLFHSRIRALSSCFPNVQVTKHEFKVDGAGHGMGPSFMQCLGLLAVPERPWKYVHLLQNHDTSLRTNLEMVRILKWLNGSNDVEITQIPGGRIDETLDWSFNALSLFKNKSRNNMTFNSYEPKLVFSKGYVESTLSRPMVDFMINELNLTELMRRIELKGFGIDEIMIPTLQASDAIAAPGGFTHHCYQTNTQVKHITRMSLWTTDGCNSNHLRHAICIFGIDDLVDHVSKYPHLFINKIMPDFDFAAVVCWYEYLFNRSYIEPPTTAHLDPNFYLNLAHVRYQYLKDRNGMVDPAKLTTFDCEGKKELSNY